MTRLMKDEKANTNNREMTGSFFKRANCSFFMAIPPVLRRCECIKFKMFGLGVLILSEENWSARFQSPP